MKGAQRVIVFCLLIAVFPIILLSIPLYLRHSLYKDVVYSVSESDILEMVSGISTFFCEEHTLTMDSEFSAYQLEGKPEFSLENIKKIHLEKSMLLPDDTLQYWGFFLPNGSVVNLAFCSRYDGSRILVVKGERELRDCGLNQPEEEAPIPSLIPGEGVMVTFEEGAKIKEVLPSANLTGSNHTRNNHSSVFNRNIDPIEEENNGAEDLTGDMINSLPEEDEDEARRKDTLEKELQGAPKAKRNIAERWLDAGMNHGGTEDGKDSSFSSFESSLLGCYEGSIFLSQGFNHTQACTSPGYLLSIPHLATHHNVSTDGYYYYIFYSDNDYIVNEIHAVFEISKPSLNHKDAPSCSNTTSCTFSLPFMSSKSVVVEIPTRDGIERGLGDKHILISTCHPRSIVYSIFPISALLLILLCAFI